MNHNLSVFCRYLAIFARIVVFRGVSIGVEVITSEFQEYSRKRFTSPNRIWEYNNQINYTPIIKSE